jgi:hypothetical protein
VPADDLAVEIRDKNNGRVVDTIKVMKRADGNVELAYAPKVPGKYSATLMNGAVPIDETIKFEFEVLPGDTPMDKRVPIKPVLPISNHAIPFALIQARFVFSFSFMFFIIYIYIYIYLCFIYLYFGFSDLNFFLKFNFLTL